MHVVSNCYRPRTSGYSSCTRNTLMKWLIIFVCLVLHVSPVAVARDDRDVTKDLALQAIIAFREDSTSSLGLAGRTVIVSFSHDSPDVIIAPDLRSSDQNLSRREGT